MNDKDYSAIKKGMRDHITATVMDRRGRKSRAKLDSGRQVVFNDHSAA